jgi:hypothetical protein
VPLLVSTPEVIYAAAVVDLADIAEEPSTTFVSMSPPCRFIPPLTLRVPVPFIVPLLNI